MTTDEWMRRRVSHDRAAVNNVCHWDPELRKGTQFRPGLKYANVADSHCGTVGGGEKWEGVQAWAPRLWTDLESDWGSVIHRT
jgi:hypothetical protein